jgi:hypothetical protein
MEPQGTEIHGDMDQEVTIQIEKTTYAIKILEK